VTWFYYALLLTATFALLFFGFTWGLFRSWCRPKRVPASVTPSAYGLAYENILTLRKLRLPTWPFLPIMQWILRRWIGMPIGRISPCCRIADIHAPILLTHSDGDGHILPSNLEALCRQANPRKVQRLVLNGCKHSDMLTDAFYIEKVKTFLSRAFHSAG